MSDHELARGLRYHLWANERVLQALRQGGEALQEAVDMFAHVVWADHLWLNRAGIVNTRPEQLNQPSNTVLADLKRDFRTVSGMWRNLIRRFNEAGEGNEAAALELERKVDYINTIGQAWTNTFGEILQHVIHHGSHHRAQISRMIRQAGRTPPVLDMIVFFREPERK